MCSVQVCVFCAVYVWSVQVCVLCAVYVWFVQVCVLCAVYVCSVQVCVLLNLSGAPAGATYARYASNTNNFFSPSNCLWSPSALVCVVWCAALCGLVVFFSVLWSCSEMWCCVVWFDVTVKTTGGCLWKEDVSMRNSPLHRMFGNLPQQVLQECLLPQMQALQKHKVLWPGVVWCGVVWCGVV